MIFMWFSTKCQISSTGHWFFVKPTTLLVGASLCSHLLRLDCLLLPVVPSVPADLHVMSVAAGVLWCLKRSIVYILLSTVTDSLSM